MILPQIEIARAHWVLGALFLVVILEEYVPRRVASDGRWERSKSLIVPWGLMIGAVGVWATTVFADVVHDMFVHFLWGDVLFAAGALEFVRRRGVFEHRWLELVLPAAFVMCGALFIVHSYVFPSDQGQYWHLAMGILLILGGGGELIRIALRRSPRITPALLPLAGFAVVLIAIPVAQAA